jgi:hypothetical protein
VAEIATPAYPIKTKQNPNQQMKPKLHLLAAAIMLPIVYSSASAQVCCNAAYGQTSFGNSGIVVR